MTEILAAHKNSWAIVPVKTLAEAKSRLSPVLTVGQRQQLALRLLTHTLTILKAAQEAELLQGFVIVSPDSHLNEIVKTFGGNYLAEDNGNNNSSLNLALGQAARWCVANKAAKMLLILPTDLPLLTLEALQEIVVAALPDSCVIVPDTLEQGTNALLLNPATRLNYNYFFGENSFRQHRMALAKEGASLLIKHNPGLAFDLDLPEDLALLPPTWWDNLPEVRGVINK